MISSVVVAVIFLIVAIALLIGILLCKHPLYIKFRKFYMATALVYLSGTVLPLVLCCYLKDMPVAYAVICEFFIAFIFAISVFTLSYIASKADDIRKEINEKS